MLLSEAARKGRRFRRTSEPEVWYYLSGTKILTLHEEAERTVFFNAEQLIATDWEPEPKKMALSAEDLISAAKSLSTHNQIVHQRRLAPVEYAKLLIEELGLDD